MAKKRPQGRDWHKSPRATRPRMAIVLALISFFVVSGCGSILPEGLFQRGSGDKAAQSERLATMTAQAQGMLANLGYQPGRADGIAGPRTREAIRDFQADSGMPQDGTVSPELLKRLVGELERSAGGQGPNSFKAASPPEYKLGSTFVYSDGLIETVIGIDRDEIRWRTNRGTIYTTNRNFILPWLAWYADGRSGERAIAGRAEDLWPLRIGGSTSFSAKTVARDSKRPTSERQTTENWQCQVEEAARITVVSGVFDTLKVVCRRVVDDGSPVLTRVWYYAPSVGHYVRMNDLYDIVESDRHVELIAIQPGGRSWPPAARAGLAWALRDALDTLSDGMTTQWSSSGVDARVTIKLRRRFERGDGKQCRNYLQTWLEAEGRHSFPGTACRDTSGVWHIPGMETSPERSLAVSDGVS